MQNNQILRARSAAASRGNGSMPQPFPISKERQRAAAMRGAGTGRHCPAPPHDAAADGGVTDAEFSYLQQAWLCARTTAPSRASFLTAPRSARALRPLPRPRDDVLLELLVRHVGLARGDLATHRDAGL